MNTLGMVEISEDNITVVEVEREDKAVILNEDTSSKGIFSGIASFFDSLLEYFR